MPNLCYTKKSQQTCTKLQNKAFRTREKNFNQGAFKMDDLKEEEKISSIIELSIMHAVQVLSLENICKNNFNLLAEIFAES